MNEGHVSDFEERGDNMEEEEEHRDTRVFRLMLPTFTGLKDEFGKESLPPLPLLVDHISEGQLPLSEAPFFRVPSEVLAEIVQHLEPSSLASFALVSRDSQQLVRSVRFASVLLDYSDSSIALIRKLLAEGEERLHSIDGTTSHPSIGACIRRITVATDASWVTRRHGISLGHDAVNEDDKAARLSDERIAEASRKFFDSYLPTVIGIFALREILPNLEVLDWEDKIAIPRSFFDNLAFSSVKHLKLYRILIDEEFEVKRPETLSSGGWPLQTLNLEVQWNLFGKSKEGSTSALCASILRLCAPTLVSLAWQNVIDSSRHSLIADAEAEDQLLQFPCLRELRLGNIDFLDAASLDALLGANLVSLIANTEKTAIHTQCFKDRGTIRSLETFVWETGDIPVDHSLDFLRANEQLSMLSLPYPVPPVLLESRLLPLLSESFKNLRSLCLVWEGDQIPTPALRIISTIKSLEQIHLSAGVQMGWRYDWLIDHHAMRSCLGSLPRLKRVAFSRDSYDNHFDFSDVTHYYIDKYFDWYTVHLVDGEDLESDDAQNAVWERLHRERILEEAGKYIDALPELEWLYFGQLPMAVGESEAKGGGGRRANLLWAERDDCWTLLKKMFGGVMDLDFNQKF